ncbi:hypothetical protein I2Q01_002726 [Staphylococcus aureus]|uniref:hypothetical protein n=1 Tax=Staphylococcus chromogenes TaxID=46126 RepID=UPI0010E39002|nr:hypothetical protein [Staphylococcus chromogenes]EAE5933060.1 hypothetical protein [Listeria monocytogenes]EGQ1381765.1 hypothetical protein [Staphylococcus aureus]EGQ1513603.1 hypothetical protein [Staphylococcus aureus]QIN27724.1 hypothetical protein GJU84_11550 [Staphylococcus chromogenes]
MFADNEVVYLTKDINNSILEKAIVFDRDNRLINENVDYDKGDLLELNINDIHISDIIDYPSYDEVDEIEAVIAIENMINKKLLMKMLRNALSCIESSYITTCR